MHDAGHRVAGRIVDPYRSLGYHGDVAIFEINEPPGFAGQGEDIRSDEVFSVTQTDHERTATASRNQLPGFACGNHANGVSAFENLASVAHGLKQ